MGVEELPQNALLSILLPLDLKSLCKVKMVSKKWLGLISPNQPFWRQKFESDFGKVDQENEDFEKEYKIEFAWRFQAPKVTELNLSASEIYDVKIEGRILLAMAIGNVMWYLEVWDLEKKECVHKIQVGMDKVSHAFHNDTLVLGKESGEIQVLGLPSGKTRKSWIAFDDDDVCDLCIRNEVLISRGISNVKIWDMENFECVNVFQAEQLKCIWVSGKELFCGASTGLIHVYHQDEGWMYDLDGNNCVKGVCVNMDYIFAHCENGELKVWDRATRHHVATLDGGEMATRDMWCDSRKVITVGCHIKVWDIKTMTCIRTIGECEFLSFCMHCDKQKMVVGQGPYLKVLEFDK